MPAHRPRVHTGIRLALLGLVVVWLFSERARGRLPFWLPLGALVIVELELVLRAWRDRQAESQPAPTRRAGSGPEDADLGWGELVEDDGGGLQWVPPPPRPPRRHRAGLTVVSVAAAAALIVTAVREDDAASWSALPLEVREATRGVLQTEAGRIAGRPVRLRCDEDYAFTGARSDALGVAFPARALTYLEPSICRTLHDIRHGDHRERADNATAIVVLAHEAVHLRGEPREGVTECIALQEGVALARRLGVPGDRAARMMRAQYLEALADRSVIRLAYQLPRDCRDGGALDRNPGLSRFP